LTVHPVVLIRAPIAARGITVGRVVGTAVAEADTIAAVGGATLGVAATSVGMTNAGVEVGGITWAVDASEIGVEGVMMTEIRTGVAGAADVGAQPATVMATKANKAMKIFNGQSPLVDDLS
jgi:hypothetical protein